MYVSREQSWRTGRPCRIERDSRQSSLENWNAEEYLSLTALSPAGKRRRAETREGPAAHSQLHCHFPHPLTRPTPSGSLVMRPLSPLRQPPTRKSEQPLIVPCVTLPQTAVLWPLDAAYPYPYLPHSLATAFFCGYTLRTCTVLPCHAWMIL